MSAVLPHLEITPQRPDWLAGAPGFEPGNGGIASSQLVDGMSGSLGPTWAAINFTDYIWIGLNHVVETVLAAEVESAATGGLG
jgi:hypothetical protein